VNKIKLKLVEVFYGYQCNLSCQGCSSASDVVKTSEYDPSIESIFASIELCDMCSNKPAGVLHTKSNVFPNIVDNK
jgi:hypothetical protein